MSLLYALCALNCNSNVNTCTSIHFKCALFQGKSPHFVYIKCFIYIQNSVETKIKSKEYY